jgi:RsmE family RNA methyltransferase
LPSIAFVGALDDLLQEFAGRRDCTPIYLDAGATEHLRDFIPRVENRVLVIVGSEKGFTPREYSLLADHQVRGVKMDGFVLRAVTAAIAVVAVIKNIVMTPKTDPNFVIR